MNPHTNNNQPNGGERIIGMEGARVITAPSHSEGDNVAHAIEVKPDMFDQPVIADVLTNHVGDVAIPAEGDRVLIGYRATGRPIVLGSRYAEGDSIPEYEPGERVIGHPLSDAHVRLASDGTVHVDGDGDVVVNGGEKRPVTDVTTTTDADGYVTDVTVTRASNVYLPSQE